MATQKVVIDIERDAATIRVCTCLNIGEDDGQTTCWLHHDCSDGSCTHQDGEDDG